MLICTHVLTYNMHMYMDEMLINKYYYNENIFNLRKGYN